MTAVAIVVLAGVAAGTLVRACGRTPRARRLWWAGTLAAAGAAALAPLSPAPLAAAVAGSGLAAAAVVDAAEGRVPTLLAHGTTAASLVALVGHAWRADAWAPVLGAVALTVGVVAADAALWLAGRIAFGDVRLAAATVTGALGGPLGALLMLGGAFAAAGAAALIGRRRVPVAEPEAAAPQLVALGGPRPRPHPRPDAGRAISGPPASRRAFAPALAFGWLLAVVVA